MKSLERLYPIRALLMMGALLLACAPIAPRAWAMDINSDNANVENLLRQAKFQAYRLETDANNMTELIRSQVSWQGRAQELARIRVRINDLGKLITELQSSRVDASPWQKQAVDRMVPILHEMVAITTDEINFLNAHQDWPGTRRAAKWANQNFTAAHELANLTSDTVQYGEDRAQLATLSDDLDLHTHAGSATGGGERASK
jgi:hypothetical protein